MACYEDTPEANIFRRRYPELVSGILNPQSLADNLFAKRIISLEALQECGKERLTTEQKTRKLLEHVYTSIISIDPKNFRVFVEILRQEPYAEQLVKNLELEYGNPVLEEERSPPRKMPRMSSGPEETQLSYSGVTPSQKYESVSMVAGRKLSSLPLEESHPPQKKLKLQDAESEEVLTPNELYDVLIELHVVKAKWHVLGGTLKVKESILAAIRVEFRDIPDNCLQEMLSHWLRQGNPRPCWIALVAALRLPIVDEPKLAQTLEAKYCPGPEKIQLLSSGATLSQQPEGVSAEFSKYHDNIKTCYSKSAETDPEHFPPIKQSKCINLALIDRGQLDEYSLHTIQRSADDIYAKKKKISFDDLISSAVDGARILIEGRPGCGKTTLMSKVSREWAQEQILRSVTMLLLVPLRRFHNKEDLEFKDILKLYDVGPLVEKVNNEIALCGGQNVCILLDGIDEYSYSSSQGGLILGLMQRRFLPKSIIIATSRPASSHFLRGLADKHAEILGFLRHQIHEYIEEYYKDRDDKATALFTYLENYPNIRHMCYLPLHLAIIVYLNETLQQSMPKTETDVYLKFTNSILLHDMQKDEDPNTPLHLSSPEKLPTERLSAFRRICNLAYIVTVHSHQLFFGEDLMNVFGIQGMQFKLLGILISDKDSLLSGFEETYSFAHLTLQEFLAAYHLTRCPDAEQIQLIENFRERKSMTVVWKFYCGLTQLKSEASVEVFKIMTEQVQGCVMLDLLHFVYESQNVSRCSELVANRNGSIIIEDETLTPSDTIAVAHCIQNSLGVLSEMKLCSCRWDKEEISALTSHITVHPNVKTLCFEHTPVRKNAIPLFVGLLEKFPSVETLVLSKCISKLQSAEELLWCITAYRNLRHLNIDLTVAKSMGIDGLFSAIHSLEELRLIGSVVAVEVLKEQERVKMISLKGKKEKMLIFADRQSVTEVSLSHYKLLEMDWAVISELLKYCPRVESISLTNSAIGDRGAQELGKVLKHCPELQSLNLSGNHITAVGWKIITEALKDNQNLRTLEAADFMPEDYLHGSGGAMTLKEVEKPYQHIVKSEMETTEHVKSTGGAMTLKEEEKPYQHIVKSETETIQHVKSTDYLRGVEVFAETQFIIKGKHSQTFKWEGHGLKLSIPEGAVLSKSVINIKAGLAGQFELPSDAQLVSPMYWLHCDYSFQNPVTLELQHCASIKNQSEYSSLSFIVAKCSQELPYKFKFLHKGTFSQHSSQGSINVKQFSIFGIVKKLFSPFGLASRSYFAQLFYIDDGENAWKLDFIITWNLELCLTHIQQKYSTLAVEGPHTELQFERESISLVIPENGITNGWAITPLNPQVITKEQVDKFKPGQRIPSCQLQIQLLATDNPEILSYKLALEGAKEPFNFLTVTRTPVHGKKRPQQSEGDQIDVYSVHGRKRPQQLEENQSDEYDTVPRRKRPRHLEGSQSDVQVTTSPVEPTTSAITEIPLQPIFDERPELRELQLIKWCKGDEEKHLRIKASIAPRWKDLGITFGITLAELQAFERQNMLNQEDCCSSVFHMWLQNGSQPRDAYAVTWRGLIKALRDTSLREIANELETALHSMT